MIEKNKKKVGERFKEATKYFESNNSFKTTEVDYYLATISNYLGDKKSSPVDGFYGRFSQEENLINLLKNKEYEKALSSLNPEAIAKSNSSYEVTIYDILNVLVNGKQVKNLYCTDEFTKYPNSYAYSTIVCGLLTDYLKNNSFDKKHMDRAKVYFNEEAQDKRYMLDMVKEINK